MFQRRNSKSPSAATDASPETELMHSILGDNSIVGDTATTQQELQQQQYQQPPNIRLGLFWDEWARCIGSRYQADHLYRVGRLDSCANQWRDLKIATQARFLVIRDPKQALALMESTHYNKRTTISPTAGVIWELADKPGWN